jgi:hypothetical protein
MGLLRQAGIDVVEYGVQAGLQGAQTNDDANGDDGRDEGILDGGYAGLVFEKIDEASSGHADVTRGDFQQPTKRCLTFG